MRKLGSALLCAVALVACGGSTSLFDGPGDAGADVDAPAPPDAPVPDAPVPDAPVPDAPVAERLERVPDRALVKWITADPVEPWWIEERIAPQPMVEGDRDLGPRAIVRAAPDRRVVWQPPASDRLVDACRHPSGQWSAVGVDHELRVFLARGDASGVIDRVALDAHVHPLSEASPKIAADGEDVVVALMDERFAVTAHRFARQGAAFVAGPRTLVSPAVPVTPFLPIGGSYDDFDAVVSPYVIHLGVDGAGRAFVAQLADRGRLMKHNAHFGTELDLLRDTLYPREATSDALVSRVDRDGTIAFARVVGTPDFEDEIFGLAVSDDRVAVIGRRRRELGRDNTELHAMVAELSTDGAPLSTTTFDGVESALAQTGAYVGADLLVGGTEGWRQNPSGRSVFAPGRPFLIRLHGELGARTIERLDARVPSTSGHAELRAVAVGAGSLFVGGHENGPLTHTGDADRSLIRSDAYFAISTL